ncbi:MAG: carboxypeptidase regulatory-like domain-containing protein [Chloroflexi bacterium]|nr:carboxypeptidase regulatory-like domain-containing protein [Chloroflexota bacterium]
MKYYLVLAGMILILLVSISACTPQPAAPASTSPWPPTGLPLPVTAVPASGGSITGVVLDSQGAPVPQATVRIQATTNETKTDEDGRFVLVGLEEGTALTVSAWKQDYYCAKAETVLPPAGDVPLTLRLYQTNDNPDYQWIPPTGENSCYSCKPGVTQVWLDNDAHGKSASNIRYLTMYNGTDIHGNQSPLTRYGYSRDYGRIPLRPDPNQPYFGPGYKLDFSDTAGNCAACHNAGAAVDLPYGIDPNRVSGVESFGIHCDYCHKIADVRLNLQNGLPYPNMPGVLSQDIRRPFPEDEDRYQLFFGSFDDDNVPQEDTFLPLIKESQFCAPCHFGVFWDTVIYNSFGEWLDSPYSEPQTGKTCQQCHMPVPTMLDGQPLTNVAPDKGGVERDPMTIPAHTFPGAANLELLQNSVTMTASARRIEDQILVEVEILNDKTGHHIPTDSPLRQMILLVQAESLDGKPLELIQGSTVPDWGGLGDPAEGYYAGLPGKGYAKILMELWTEITPSGAYWNPTRVLSDNRIPAMDSDTTTYIFSAPPDGRSNIRVRLLYRRAFKELMDLKDWDVPDIVMEEVVRTLP